MNAKLPSISQRDDGAVDNITAALKILSKLEFEILNAPTFEALDAASNKAAGMQRAHKHVPDVANKAGEVWVKAERKLGKELADMPKAIGTRGQLIGRGHIGGSSSEPPIGPATLSQMGVAKHRSVRAQKLYELPDHQMADIVSTLKDKGKGITPNAVLAAIRIKTKEEKRHDVSVAEFSEEGPFDVVVIDPPWKMEKIDRDVRPNQDAFDYPTMTNEELVAFWERDMADRINPDCHLFMWTTQKFLPDALNLAELFGFRYVFTMVWHKPGGFQPIDLPQYNCEFIVYARRGTPLFVETKHFNCCFEAPRREHSRKPDFFYDTVRRVTGGSRIDVFSREPREGFAQFGNENRKFQKAS